MKLIILYYIAFLYFITLNNFLLIINVTVKTFSVYLLVYRPIIISKSTNVNSTINSILFNNSNFLDNLYN